MSLIGKRIGKIRIVESLGQGGMGQVFLGYDEKLKRNVAVKVMGEGHRMDPETKRRFLYEAELLSRLEHPNICRVYDWIEEDDRDCLVLEYIRGENLRAALNFGLNHAAKLRIAIQIAEVLVEAHAQNIIHRDLKPENVMLTQSGDIKVLDFGLAFATRDEHLTVVHPVKTNGSEDEPESGEASDTARRVPVVDEKGVLGTPMYMSPEQAKGETVNASGDMYSFGLLLQWLFTEKDPYPGNITRTGLMIRAMRGDSLPIDGVEANLTALIDRLKHVSPDLRPTAVEATDRLKWIQATPKRRFKRLVTLSFVALLLLGTGVSTVGFVKARRSEREAIRAHEQSKAVNAFLKDMLTSANPWEEGDQNIRVDEVLRRAASNVDENFADHPINKASVLNTLGNTFLAIGDYERAETHLDGAWRLRREKLGPNHPESVAAAKDLARLQMHRGEFARAETEFRRIFDIATRTVGPNDELTLQIMDDLVDTLLQQGHVDEAEGLARQVLSSRTASLGDHHRLTLNAKHNLALVLRQREKFDDSEALFREILQARQKTLGDTHSRTLYTKNSLAHTLFVSGDIDQAETLMREVYETFQQVLAGDHSYTLAAAHNLASLLLNQGKLKEAEQLLTEVLEKKTASLGGEHPNTLVSLSNLASIKVRKGALSQAEKLYQDVVAGRKKSLGPGHPKTLVSMNTLARVLELEKKFEEAERWYHEFVEISARELGDTHPMTMTAIQNLAVCLFRQARFEESERCYRDVLKKRRHVLGNEHPDTIRTMHDLGSLLMHQNRDDEAIPLLKETVSARTVAQGADHADTARTICDLAHAFEATGRLTDAAAEYRKAVSLGSSRGQLALAKMFEKGRGVQENRDEAIRLYRLAAKQDVAEAEKALRRLDADRD